MFNASVICFYLVHYYYKTLYLLFTWFIKVKAVIPQSAYYAQETRVTTARMATSGLVETAYDVHTLAATSVQTATVVTRARLGTGDKRVTARVVLVV